MLPYIIAGAASVIGYAGYKLGRECSLCNKRMKWTHNCINCKKVLCSACGTSMPKIFRDQTTLRSTGFTCSSSCTLGVRQRDHELTEAHDAKVERQRKRLSRISQVRLVSINYGGPQKTTSGEELETEWHDDKQAAENSARVMAVDVYDTDTVWFVKTIFKTCESSGPKGGTYRYRRWKVTGVV